MTSGEHLGRSGASSREPGRSEEPCGPIFQAGRVKGRPFRRPQRLPGRPPVRPRPSLANRTRAAPPSDHGTVPDRAAWLDRLPGDLASHERLLRALVRWCDEDTDARWLAVGCSFARGDADVFSDLDVAIGVTDGQVEAAAGRVVEALGGFGDLVECFHHRLEMVTVPHRRVFAQFADRAQVDLVLVDASNAALPGTVVLYDPAGLVASGGTEAAAASAEQVRTWACLAWESLANVGKYLRRGSAWEAHRSLEAARDHAWQLFAVAAGIPEPEYGVTSVLDVPGQALPMGIEETIAGLDLGELLRAARRLAALLEGLQERLGGDALPEALARFVIDDLDALHLGR